MTQDDLFIKYKTTCLDIKHVKLLLKFNCIFSNSMLF